MALDSRTAMWLKPKTSRRLHRTICYSSSPKRDQLGDSTSHFKWPSFTQDWGMHAGRLKPFAWRIQPESFIWERRIVTKKCTYKWKLEKKWRTMALLRQLHTTVSRAFALIKLPLQTFPECVTMLSWGRDVDEGSSWCLQNETLHFVELGGHEAKTQITASNECCIHWYVLALKAAICNETDK